MRRVKLIIAIIKPYTLEEVRQALEAAADLASRIVQTIRDAANTGALGRGKIFTLGIGDALRRRAGKTAETAL